MSSLTEENIFEERLDYLLDILNSNKSNEKILEFPDIDLDTNTKLTIFNNAAEFFKILRYKRVRRSDKEYVNKMLIDFISFKLSGSNKEKIVYWENNKLIIIKNNVSRKKLGNIIIEIIDKYFRCKNKECNSINTTFYHHKKNGRVYDELKCNFCDK